MGNRIPDFPEGIEMQTWSHSGIPDRNFFMVQREINSVLQRIDFKDIKENPCILVYPHCDGIYDMIPFNCKVSGYVLRTDQFLRQTEEKRLEGKVELTTSGFAFSEKITLYDSEEDYPEKRLLQKIKSKLQN